MSTIAKWVKAYDRLPQKRDIYFVKVVSAADSFLDDFKDCIMKDTWIMENGKRVYNSFQKDYNMVLVEWLDENP